MAKRFCDTLIWEKEWFMKLSPKHKCLFRYLTERCDPAGVWEPNWILASLYIGEYVDQSDLLLLNDQVEKLPSGKIWLSGFILFQYGKLSEKSPAHIPVYKSIEKNDLVHRVFNRVPKTLEEKEKEMVKEEEKEKEEDSGRYITIGDKRVFDVIPILEHKAAALNGRQKEHKTRSWKDVAPEWFETVIQMDYNDEAHVFNSFSKYLITQGIPKSQTNGIHSRSNQGASGQVRTPDTRTIDYDAESSFK